MEICEQIQSRRIGCRQVGEQSHGVGCIVNAPVKPVADQATRPGPVEQSQVESNRGATQKLPEPVFLYCVHHDQGVTGSDQQFYFPGRIFFPGILHGYSQLLRAVRYDTNWQRTVESR
jgi:hypothetical protein